MSAPRLAPGEHHVCIHFDADGRIGFTPRTDNPEELAVRFRRMLFRLIEHPGFVDCAVGHHRAEDIRRG